MKPTTDREWVVCYLGLGANLGDTVRTLQEAIKALQALPDTQLQGVSSLYCSAPIDSGGPHYTNAVVALLTKRGAMDLLSDAQRIEHNHGRERPYRNAPRTLDIDLLLYGDATIDTPRLIVPHPRMWQRAFVVLPLAQLAPDLITEQVLANVAQQAIKKMF